MLYVCPAFGFTRGQKFGFRFAALVSLKVNLAVSTDFHLQVLAQRVYHGYPDPVETAGDLVGRIIEFTARMEFCHNNRYGRYFFGECLSTGIPRPLSSTVTELIQVNLDSNIVAMTRQSFVNAVIDNLIDEVMEDLL